jgi:hypothetical protein
MPVATTASCQLPAAVRHFGFGLELVTREAELLARVRENEGSYVVFLSFLFFSFKNTT